MHCIIVTVWRKRCARMCIMCTFCFKLKNGQLTTLQRRHFYYSFFFFVTVASIRTHGNGTAKRTTTNKVIDIHVWNAKVFSVCYNVSSPFRFRFSRCNLWSGLVSGRIRDQIFFPAVLLEETNLHVFHNYVNTSSAKRLLRNGRKLADRGLNPSTYLTEINSIITVKEIKLIFYFNYPTQIIRSCFNKIFLFFPLFYLLY